MRYVLSKAALREEETETITDGRITIVSDPFGGTIGQLLSEASGSIPYNLPEESINLESIRGLRVELDDVNAVLAIVVNDHVLADASGLGNEHTVSGLTAGQVLRASGAVTANFAVLDFTDLSGKIADSQVDSTVTYTNLQAVNTLNVKVPSGGQAMLIDGGTARYISMGTTGAVGDTPKFTTYSDGVRIVIDDTIGAADAGIAIGVGFSGASRAWLGVGASNGSIEFYGGTTRFAIIDNFGIFTTKVVTGEGGMTLGKGLLGEDKNLLFFGRAQSGGFDAGHIQINRIGVLRIVCSFEVDSIHFKFNPVDIDGNLSVAGAQTDIGRRLKIGGSSTTGVPSFEIHDSYQTDRRAEATEFYWSVNSTEVQTTFPTVSNWPTIRSKWYRLSSAQADVGDVVLYMPVAYVRVTGQPSDEGHLKWTVDGMPDDGGVNLEIKAELVTITGALSIGTALFIAASQITAGTFGAGNYVFPGNITIADNFDINLGGSASIFWDTTGANPDWSLAGHVSGLGPTFRREDSGGLTLSIFRTDAQSGGALIGYIRGEAISSLSNSYDAGGLRITQVSNTDNAEETQIRLETCQGGASPVEVMRLNQNGNVLIGTLVEAAGSPRLDVVGDATISGKITIGGDLIHTGTKFGVFSATPIVRVDAYIVTNDSADRSYDADSTSIDELADVIATVIADLKSYGFFQ